jgi:hypothetical protein
VVADHSAHLLPDRRPIGRVMPPPAAVTPPIVTTFFAFIFRPFRVCWRYLQTFSTFWGWFGCRMT